MLSKDDAISKSFRKTKMVVIENVGEIYVADISGKGQDALADLGEKMLAGNGSRLDYLHTVLLYGMANQNGTPFFETLDEVDKFDANIPGAAIIAIRDAIFEHNKLNSNVEDEAKN